MVGRIGADPEVTLAQAPGGGEEVLGLGLQAEEPAGQVEELAAELRRSDLAASAIEEANAVALLQPLDLPGKGRLGHVERRGGAGEASFAGHGMEGAELGIFHRQCLYEV